MKMKFFIYWLYRDQDGLIVKYTTEFDGKSILLKSFFDCFIREVCILTLSVPYK